MCEAKNSRIAALEAEADALRKRLAEMEAAACEASNELDGAKLHRGLDQVESMWACIGLAQVALQSALSGGTPALDAKIAEAVSAYKESQPDRGALPACANVPHERPDQDSGAATAAVSAPLSCFDCTAPYGCDGWVDVVVPHDVWLKISPTGHEGGVLCFRCMTKRLEAVGYSPVNPVPVIISSGPYTDDNEGWRMRGLEQGRQQIAEAKRPLVEALEKARDLLDYIRSETQTSGEIWGLPHVAQVAGKGMVAIRAAIAEKGGN